MAGRLRAGGFTLLELLIASVIFVVVGIAVGTFYLATVRGFERGSAQAYVQRVGSQVESELVRHLTRAVAFHSTWITGDSGSPCGNAAASASLLFERPSLSGMVTTVLHPCRFCCVYQVRETATFAGHPVADTFPQFYVCEVASTGGNCIPLTAPGVAGQESRQQLTAGAPRSLDTGVAGIVAVDGTTFTRVTSICNIAPFDPCGSSNTALNCNTETGSNCIPASAPRVEARFLICQPDPQASTTTPCTDPLRPPVFTALRFGLTATARN
jgi:prepilin-type N-terminal cleavage/methylation domain-containing protein